MEQVVLQSPQQLFNQVLSAPADGKTTSKLAQILELLPQLSIGDWTFLVCVFLGALTLLIILIKLVPFKQSGKIREGLMAIFDHFELLLKKKDKADDDSPKI